VFGRGGRRHGWKWAGQPGRICQIVRVGIIRVASPPEV
jgi:hypothetical protein